MSSAGSAGSAGSGNGKKAGGLAAALARDVEHMSLTRRNTSKKFDVSQLEDSGLCESGAGTPRGYSRAGNPLVDYAKSLRASRDVAEFAPRSIEEATFLGSSYDAAAGHGEREGPFWAPVSPSPGSLRANFLSEGVIRSLPKPLEPAERERAIREKAQTPTFELVRKVNKYKSLVNESSSQGQELRRQLLSGAVVVIICAGYSGKRFIYEKAKELGVRLIVIDGPDNWSQVLVEEGVIEQFVALNMSNPPAVFNEALKLVQGIDADIGGIDGICTFWEVAVPLVARLTESLGLPGNSAQSIDCARDKYQTRAKLKEANLPTPSNFMIASDEDLPKAEEVVGFPAVLKPVNGAASLGVVRVNTTSELAAKYKEVCSILETCSTTDVHGFHQSDKPKDEDPLVKGIMLEQYLDGDEVDIDVILSDGKVTYAKVTDNLPTHEPWFNETGACTPSILPVAVQRELEEMSVKMCKALGLSSGVMHVEMKYTTNNGPQLIEVNARMGGGPVRDMNLAVWGVDFVEEQLMACVGLPATPPIPSKPIKCLGQYSVNARKSGTIGPEFPAILEKLRQMPDVVCVDELVKPGDLAVGLGDGMPTWLADIIVEKPTAEEAVAYVQQLEADLEQPIL